MKKINKLLAILATGAVSVAAFAGLASCDGETSAEAVGVYHYEAMITSAQGMRIQSGITESLTLYSDNTYELAAYMNTWRSADIESGDPFANYGAQVLVVFGTYEVTGTTPGDEADAPTTTVALSSAITRSIYYCTGCTSEDVDEYAYLGDSDDMDADAKAAALAFFAPTGGTTVTVNESTYSMTTGFVGLTLLKSIATLEISAGK